MIHFPFGPLEIVNLDHRLKRPLRIPRAWGTWIGDPVLRAFPLSRWRRLEGRKENEGETHQGGDEAAVQLPHDGQEAHDVLLDDADPVAGHVDEQRVRRRLHRVRVPLLVVLGLDERLLAVLVHHRVEVHRLAGPVDLVACEEWGAAVCAILHCVNVIHEVYTPTQ